MSKNKKVRSAQRIAIVPAAIMAALAALAALAAQPIAAQEQTRSTDRIYEEVLVTGGRNNIRKLSGSATLLDESQIQAFDSIDINNLLRQVPGVYLRVEDGFGLRPNIGLRGATSERSQKITLMEDGVLIAPAPYSAPAAYYMPNVNRMDSIEVFKGPAAIKYGPHTVGGALNLVTAPIPEYAEGKLEAVLGTDNYQKYRAVYGETVGQWGYSLDGLRYSSDGFKDLDGGGDTGFERNDINAKLQWRSSNTATIEQTVQLKLGYADEDSDETYLGLTDEDFASNSVRRYIASEQDQFTSDHYQAHLFHYAQLSDAWQVNTRAYYNYFERDWLKFDGFIGASAQQPSVILANPDIYAREIALLRGELDSNGTERETIDVTNFARDYTSTGVETRLKHQLNTGELAHNIEVGLRYHYDSVDRDQEQFGYLVQGGRLSFDNVSRPLTLSNAWDTEAISTFLADSVEWKKFTIDLGLRYEHIQGEAKNNLSRSVSNTNQKIWLPGVGAFYQWSDNWGLLAGINKGFSPASPGATGGVDPEESINYEYGVRYTGDKLTADLIGFFSDYENLLGRCRVSDPNCNPGDEFNGGEIEIAGAEVTGTYTHSVNDGLWIPVSFVYTYTETAFQSTFTSNFSQWNPGFFNGALQPVRQGDELPYTPDHQARLQVGLAAFKWEVNMAIRYVSEMREVPGRGSYRDGESTDDYSIIDMSAKYDISNDLTVQLVLENVSDEEKIVSRRPFGARPNLPRQVKVGLSYSF
jgi:Fe(3+) dicitrate transport protein